MIGNITLKQAVEHAFHIPNIPNHFPSDVGEEDHCSALYAKHIKL
jgi:hypothetical protein